MWLCMIEACEMESINKMSKEIKKNPIPTQTYPCKWYVNITHFSLVLQIISSSPNISIFASPKLAFNP